MQHEVPARIIAAQFNLCRSRVYAIKDAMQTRQKVKEAEVWLELERGYIEIASMIKRIWRNIKICQSERFGDFVGRCVIIKPTHFALLHAGNSISIHASIYVDIVPNYGEVVLLMYRDQRGFVSSRRNSDD